jgi:hypothetical protein
LPALFLHAGDCLTFIDSGCVLLSGCLQQKTEALQTSLTYDCLTVIDCGCAFLSGCLQQETEVLQTSLTYDCLTVIDCGCAFLPVVGQT